jgi:hypothetical protein
VARLISSPGRSRRKIVPRGTRIRLSWD